jgi:5-methylcytosine-specific restriction endonuclease McrA
VVRGQSRVQAGARAAKRDPARGVVQLTVVARRPEKSSCWICGAPADSAEHRIKKAELVRVYGRGPYRGDAAPIHVRGNVETPIQGPGSSAVKYAPSLCQHCNTTRTQPYDRAYDHFISWVVANESAVLHKRMIDFAEVYGASFEEAQRNLFKYFVKNLGCRLVDTGELVPPDLVELLPRVARRLQRSSVATPRCSCSWPVPGCALGKPSRSSGRTLTLTPARSEWPARSRTDG